MKKDRIRTARNGIVYGEGSLRILKELTGKGALIVSDKGLRTFGLIDNVKTILKERIATISIFDEVEPDPSIKTV